MTVKEFHAICYTGKEMYINQDNEACIKLDYDKEWDSQEFSEWERFKAIEDRTITGFWIRTDRDGKPWMVANI